MTQLVWDATGERQYETGVSRGVLYLPDVSGLYSIGYAWNGLTAVSESPSGAEANAFYADNQKYLNLVSAEEFACTIEAYTYPKQFAQCDGSVEPIPGVSLGQQARKPFAFSYQTKIGNDTQGDDFGYKIHIVYNGLAAPSEKAYNTVNESPEPITFSWEVTTTPVQSGSGRRPVATITLDSTVIPSAKLKEVEDILYGTAVLDPRCPLPEELLAILAGAAPTEVTPTTPTFVAATGVVTIPTVAGVEYRVDGTKRTGTYTIPNAGQTKLVKAIALPGYKFAEGVDDDWSFTRD